jgi:hypothetical protein
MVYEVEHKVLQPTVPDMLKLQNFHAGHPNKPGWRYLQVNNVLKFSDSSKRRPGFQPVLVLVGPADIAAAAPTWAWYMGMRVSSILDLVCYYKNEKTEPTIHVAQRSQRLKIKFPALHLICPVKKICSLNLLWSEPKWKLTTNVQHSQASPIQMIGSPWPDVASQNPIT